MFGPFSKCCRIIFTYQRDLFPVQDESDVGFYCTFCCANPLLLNDYSRCWKSQHTNLVDFHIEAAVEGSQGQLWIRRLYNFLSFSEETDYTSNAQTGHVNTRLFLFALEKLVFERCNIFVPGHTLVLGYTCRGKVWMNGMTWCPVRLTSVNDPYPSAGLPMIFDVASVL